MGFLQGDCFETEPKRVVREAEQVTWAAAHPEGWARFSESTFVGALDAGFATKAYEHYLRAFRAYEPSELEQQLAEWNERGAEPPTEDK